MIVFDVETGEMTKSLEAESDERILWAVKFCGEDTGMVVYRRRSSKFLTVF